MKSLWVIFAVSLTATALNIQPAMATGSGGSKPKVQKKNVAALGSKPMVPNRNVTALGSEVSKLNRNGSSAGKGIGEWFTNWWKKEVGSFRQRFHRAFTDSIKNPKGIAGTIVGISTTFL